jgi:hypothetical protein
MTYMQPYGKAALQHVCACPAHEGPSCSFSILRSAAAFDNG